MTGGGEMNKSSCHHISVLLRGRREGDYFNKGSCTAMGKCLLKVFQPMKVRLWLSSVSAEIRLQIIGGMDALTGVSLMDPYRFARGKQKKIQ